MKAMWNLMHVMQVLAYLKMLIDWPTNAEMVLTSVYDAITLENIIPDYDSYIFGEEDEEELIIEEEKAEEVKLLEEKNLSPSDNSLNLGIFGILLSGLILAVILYFLLKLLAMKFKILRKLVHFMHNKLFYNAWIRYMIESNLITTHSCIFYL